MKKLNIFEMQKVNGGKVDGLVPPKTPRPKKQTIPSGLTMAIHYVLSYDTLPAKFANK